MRKNASNFYDHFRDIAELLCNPLDNVYFKSDYGDINRSYAMMIGTGGTPYEYGFFHFCIRYF